MTEPAPSAGGGTTLYLVRHGESEANAARVFAGQLDSPLTERGRRQAEAVAEALADLPITRVVSSDLSRTRETAEAIARRHGLRVDAFPELREIDVGAMQGKSWEDAEKQRSWDPDGFIQWPGGEDLDAVLTRAMPVLQRIVNESAGRSVVIVGHGGVTRILVSHFKGLLPALERSRAANANITEVVHDGGRFEITRLFDTAHVPTPPPSPEAASTRGP